MSPTNYSLRKWYWQTTVPSSATRHAQMLQVAQWHFFINTINAYMWNITSEMTSVRSHIARDTLVEALNSLSEHCAAEQKQRRYVPLLSDNDPPCSYHIKVIKHLALQIPRTESYAGRKCLNKGWKTFTKKKT